VRDVVYGLLATACTPANAPHLGVAVVDATAADRFAARVLSATIDDLHRGLRPGPLDPASEQQLDTHLWDVDVALAHRETIAAALIEMHGEDTPLRGFLDACRLVDGAILQWRDRHLRFVEGIIGIRRGTGGGGMRYLRQTVDAHRETFLTHGLPALWQARTFVHRT
jgi:tryptophan 2,3-dioxygenase